MIRQEKDGLVWYESTLLSQLGVKHGFFTSIGGFSQDQFAELNVKNGIGDDQNVVEKNRIKIMNQFGAKKLKFAKLVHGSEMLFVDEKSGDEVEVNDVDSLATDLNGIGLAISTADCVPIIVSDGKIVAVVHAGWRGTVEQIATKTVKQLVERGLDLEKSVAAIGPCICKQHFEVKGEAAEKLSQLGGEPNTGNSYFADLTKLNMDQLADAGVEKLEALGVCSYESQEFFSHRGARGKTGRNMTLALL